MTVKKDAEPDALARLMACAAELPVEQRRALLLTARGMAYARGRPTGRLKQKETNLTKS